MRQSELERAIAALEAKRDALDLAIAELRDQLTVKRRPTKAAKPQPVAPTKATA
jgi:hypothetical protein